MEFEQIWSQFSIQVLNYIKQKVDRIEDAEDIFQDVFIKVFLKLDSLHKVEKIGAWLFQITRNNIRDFYRKNAKMPQQVDNPTILEDTLAEDKKEKDFMGCLTPIIKELPEKYEQVILLSDVEGKKYQEIADELGLSLSGVKTRVQRGRELLKEGFISCCQYKKDQNGKLVGEGDCQRLACNCSN